VIAAHGSWERGAMPTQAPHQPAGAGDLFGFKVHFEHAGLDHDLMPLLSFPGGYGGMVNRDDGRLSQSFCIRRDALAACRRLAPSCGAGNAALTHIQASCRGVAQTLHKARRSGPWLAAGPLRTGLRGFGAGGCYTVGNATAEAHPIVAEGLSMAMQSAGLLCDVLLRNESPGRVWSRMRLQQVRATYAAAWHQHFAQRLNLAAFAAHVFMRPGSARLAALTLQGLPSLLSRAALWSGKAQSFGLDLGALGAAR
jgi:flavin-dependent dehydrogenase